MIQLCCLSIDVRVYTRINLIQYQCDILQILPGFYQSAMLSTLSQKLCCIFHEYYFYFSDKKPGSRHCVVMWSSYTWCIHQFRQTLIPRRFKNSSKMSRMKQQQSHVMEFGDMVSSLSFDISCVIFYCYYMTLWQMSWQINMHQI